MDLHLNDIALYVEVARRGNISRAARVLNMPASTLTRRVDELERQLGMRLLSRSRQGVALTEAGQMYYERCQPLIERARMAHVSLQDTVEIPRGKLRISLHGSLADLFLPAVMDEFIRTYPLIECEFDVSAAVIDPARDPCDLALRLGKQPDSSLIARKLGEMSWDLYAAPAYLARHGEPASPQDLVDHECLRSLLEEQNPTWELRCGPDTQRVEVAGRLTANQAELLFRLAAAGLGIAALPACEQVRGWIEGSGLLRVLPAWRLAPVPLYALTPTRVPSARVRAFLDFIEPRLQAGLHAAH
ncbi:LysR substrate-binding domain-containing protein [Bordetella sp. LUAb4]|uniref:LysR substrate-binding domain-containing protein n=1 Tax=Bordetella sp. LUAb4 TaxID=2843195 RepID=UPI001E4A9E0C|nr:LysR family transcriptional regulator [Bordetella sp. LUAb4]